MSDIPKYRVNQLISTDLAPPRIVDEDTLSLFCLNVCGGGWTESQTAKAMEMLRAIREGKPYTTASGIHIEVIPQ
jgi:hypothetical protein